MYTYSLHVCSLQVHDMKCDVSAVINIDADQVYHL